MLEEARQRENQMTEDMTKLQVYSLVISLVDVLRYHFLTRMFQSEFYRYAKLVFQVTCRSAQGAAWNFLHRTGGQLVLMQIFLCYQMDMKEKSDRVEELEAALRESVTITAQREMLMAQQQQKLEHGEKQVSSQM